LYKKVQISPTETDERMVGKKNSVLKKMLLLLFLARKIAKRSEKEVWKITTKSVNFKLFPRIFRNKMSLESMY
jgi:hypothetical protein